MIVILLHRSHAYNFIYVYCDFLSFENRVSFATFSESICGWVFV